MHMDQRLAHGTSLAAVLPIAVSSLIGYTLADKVDWPVGALLAIGAVGGAVIGTHILHVLPQRVLGYVFAGFLLLTAVRLVVDHASAGTLRADGRTGRGARRDRVGDRDPRRAAGRRRGIVMVPAMIVLFGIPAVVAKGTSLAVIVPTAVMGTWRNRTKHNTDLRVAAVVGVAGIVSAFGASQVSVGLSETTSNVLFALLLAVVAVRMLWQLRTERRAMRAAVDAADAAEATAG